MSTSIDTSQNINYTKEGGYESKDYFPNFGIRNLKSDIEFKTKSYLEKIVDL